MSVVLAVCRRMSGLRQPCFIYTGYRKREADTYLVASIVKRVKDATLSLTKKPLRGGEECPVDPRSDFHARPRRQRISRTGECSFWLGYEKRGFQVLASGRSNDIMGTKLADQDELDFHADDITLDYLI